MLWSQTFLGNTGKKIGDDAKGLRRNRNGAFHGKMLNRAPLLEPGSGPDRSEFLRTAQRCANA